MGYSPWGCKESDKMEATEHARSRLISSCDSLLFRIVFLCASHRQAYLKRLDSRAPPKVRLSTTLTITQTEIQRPRKVCTSSMFTQLICSSKDLNPEGLNSRIQSVNYNIGLPFTEYWAHQWSPHFRKDAEQIKTNLAGKQQENRNIENPVL